MDNFFKFSNILLDSARLFFPTHARISDIVEKRPDPQDRGDWQKHAFVPEPEDSGVLVNNLNYFVFKPEPTIKQPSTEGMPLVVMLHGCKQTAPSFAQGTQMNKLAQSHGFVALYPQQSIRNNIIRCWRWFDRGEFSGMAEMRTLRQMIHTVIDDYQLDKEKVFLVGLSAGAGMASMLAVNHSDEFCAVALHSGPVLNKAHNITSGLQIMADKELESDACLVRYLSGFTPERFKMPAMIIQGVNDLTVDKSNATELSRQFLYLNNLPMDSEPTVQRHEEDTVREYRHAVFRDRRQSMVEVIKACSLEHAWGGGDTSLPYNSVEGPDSSRLIIDFFKRCSRQFNTRKNW
ncbi:MAG: PHB depolymerase family esterase [Alcaligenaceae bacterium]|nr:PHB depolymerase family esterase [Alcaligenaceae bacterium]